MAKLILRDNLTGSIDVSHYVHCILAGFLSGEAGGAFTPHGFGLSLLFACQLIQNKSLVNNTRYTVYSDTEYHIVATFHETVSHL